jgi:hypothetical protein
VKNYPHILLIAGTGRNSGKTTLAANIIRRFAARHDLTAVKISPHFHSAGQGLKRIETAGHFAIFLEQAATGDKDSARMLAAGAKKVYYIEVHDAHLPEAFGSLMKRIPPSSPVVCESPSLATVIIPGVFFIADHPRVISKKSDVLSMATQADRFINTSVDDLEDILNLLEFDEGRWLYNPRNSLLPRGRKIG